MARALLLLLLLPLVATSAPTDPLGLMAVSREHAAALAQLDLMVEGGTRDVLHAHGTADDRARLDDAGIPYTVLTTDITSLRPTLGVGPRDVEYHTPETLSASLRELAAAYPDIARVVDLGASWEGRELTGLVLTDRPSEREPDEPSLRVLGTHHGDEWSSMEVAWSVAWTLADGYGVDQGVTELLDSAEVWVLPIVNPDGVIAFTRRNSRGVDLNRNYGFEWRNQSSGGTAPFSERESDAVRLMGRQRAFAHSLTMHSGATNLGWVWNWTLGPTEDDDVLQSLSERYLANTLHPEFWITNGADWYVTNGDTNDWSYGVRGTHDYTLEISDEKAPPESELEQYLDWHVGPSVTFLLDGFTTGVRGVVQDEGGRGVEATLLSDLDPWPLYTDPETGAFARPMSEGTHTLTVTAPGHEPTTVEVIVGPVASGATEVPVTLSALRSWQIEGAEGLSCPADERCDALVCGPDALTHAGNGGTWALHRPGLGTFPLESAILSGLAPCVVLELEPAAIENAWDVLGEWTLLATGGAEVASMPLAVAFRTPSPDGQVETVEAAADKSGHVLTLTGDDLPEGASLRMLGPDARRRSPIERFPDGGTDTNGVAALSARFDTTDWPDGAYSVRVLGGGEVLSLDEALWLEGGVFTSMFVPPGDDDDSAPGDDDDSAPGDDDDSTADDDDASGDDDDSSSVGPSGCSGCENSGGSGTLALLALSLPLSLRRRRTRS